MNFLPTHWHIQLRRSTKTFVFASQSPNCLTLLSCYHSSADLGYHASPSTSDRKLPDNGVDMHANPDTSRRQHVSQCLRHWHVVSDGLPGWLHTLTLRYMCKIRPQDAPLLHPLFEHCGLSKSCKATFQSIGVTVISLATLPHMVFCTQPMTRNNPAVWNVICLWAVGMILC